MSLNTNPGFYASLYTAMVSAAAIVACTTRAPTLTANLAAANIFSFVPTTGNTQGRRIETIRVKACSSSFVAPTVGQTITIWRHDGTTAYPLFEIEIQAKTPSTSAKSYEQEFPCDVRLMSTDSLYYSTSITTTAATTAFDLHAEGGNY